MRKEDAVLKSKAAILYLLNRAGGIMGKVKLYKLLYFAQRLSLTRYAQVLIPDTFEARDRGPVPSLINASLKHISTPHIDNPEFDFMSDGIIIQKHDKIKALTTPDMDELSETDIECLDEIWENYGHLNAKELSALSHEDAAWQRANNRRMDDPDQSRMTRLEIAKAGHASKEVLDYLRYQIYLDQALPK